MSTQQPEALRLAETLDVDAANGDMGRKPDQKCHKRQAAAELRRLHSVNAELLEALKAARNWHNGDKWRDDSTAEQRAAWGAHRDVMDAAIAKATGEQA